MKAKQTCSIVFRNEQGEDNVVLTFPSKEKREKVMNFFRILLRSISIEIKIVGDKKLLIPAKNGKVEFFLSNNGNQRKKEREILRELQKMINLETRVIYPKVNNKTEKGYRNFTRRRY